MMRPQGERYTSHLLLVHVCRHLLGTWRGYKQAHRIFKEGQKGNLGEGWQRDSMTRLPPIVPVFPPAACQPASSAVPLLRFTGCSLGPENVARLRTWKTVFDIHKNGLVSCSSLVVTLRPELQMID